MPEARADLVANQVDLPWLSRYPLPIKITVDRDKELFLVNVQNLKCTYLRTILFYFILHIQLVRRFCSIIFVLLNYFSFCSIILFVRITIFI